MQFAASFPYGEEVSDSRGRLRGLFNTNELDGGKAHDPLRFQTPRSNEQDDLVQVLATFLSRSPSFTGHGVEACFEAARAAVRYTFSHVCHAVVSVVKQQHSSPQLATHVMVMTYRVNNVSNKIYTHLVLRSYTYEFGHKSEMNVTLFVYRLRCCS